MTYRRNPGATTDAEDEVLDRLRIYGPRQVTGLANPDRQQAALDLARRGLIKVWPGEGRDHGLVMACAAVVSGVRSSGGGDAA